MRALVRERFSARYKIPPWTDSVVDALLRKMSAAESRELERDVLRCAEDRVAPFIDEGYTYAEFREECLPLYDQLPEWEALVYLCAVHVHHIAGRRIGGRWHRREPYHVHELVRAPGTWITVSIPR